MKAVVCDRGTPGCPKKVEHGICWRPNIRCAYCGHSRAAHADPALDHAFVAGFQEDKR